MVRPSLLAGLAFGLLRSASAQWSGWSDGQINTTLCQWAESRVIILRDTVYIDGGRSWWSPGLNTGEYGKYVIDDNKYGYILTLSLNESIDLKPGIVNITQRLATNLTKATGGSGNSVSNNDPNYRSGALLGNSAEFFLYGGYYFSTGIEADPADNYFLSYKKYAYGPKYDFSPGFTSGSMDNNNNNNNNNNINNNTNRYAVFGAGATVPSEWKAFYFSGMKSANGPLAQVASRNASNQTWSYLSDQLITLTTDANNHLTQEWSNITLPSSVQPRTGGEFVFVPVGKNGIMVAVGGVTYPSWNNTSFKSENSNLSTSQGTAFHRTIDIYDIGADKWYKQNTSSTNLPPLLSRGCAVMSAAQDKSSFNIYYYGGYTALNDFETNSDDVWALSLPSFTWTKVYSGDTTHGRRTHQCVQPYPDQMMVIGGISTNYSTCLNGGIVQMFNLSSLEWMESYDPKIWTNYTVPTALTNVIGGTATGNATKTSPDAGWDDDNLKSLFSSAYSTSKIVNYYPYTAAIAGSAANGSESGGANDSTSSGGISKGAIAAIVVCCVIGFVVLLGLFLWWRRRNVKRFSETGTTISSNNSRIMAWIRGFPADAVAPKAMTETTDTTATFAGGEPMDVFKVPKYKKIVELPATENQKAAVELPAAVVQEMADTGLTPQAVVNRMFERSGNSHSPISGVSVTDHASSHSRGAISNDDSTISPQSPALPQSPTLPNGESPTTGLVASQGNTRIISDVSMIGDRDRMHLRQTSEVTVSTISEHGENVGAGSAAAGGVRELSREAIPESPASEVAEERGLDSVSMDNAGKPYPGSGRRSVFHESRDDLGEATMEGEKK